MADMGIGETMLLSAAIGGGTAAISNQDPIKGALMGAGTGALGYGASSLIGDAVASGNAANVTGNLGSGAFQGTNAVVDAGSQLGSTTNMAGASNALESGSAMMPPGAGTSFGAGNYGAANTGIGSLAVPPTGAAPGMASSMAPTGIAGTAPQASNFFTQNAGKVGTGLAGLMASKDMQYRPPIPGQEKYEGPLSKFSYNPLTYQPDVVRPPSPAYQAQYAEGGIAGLDQNTMYPQSQQQVSKYAVPSQLPVGADAIRAGAMQPTPMAKGGIADLGGYSDGGQLLKGPGNGTSDSIPATISGKQPARLADGEFVLPARIVSEIGNGSTDAGARELYKMMDRIQSDRSKTVGKNKVAVDAKARNKLPA